MNNSELFKILNGVFPTCRNDWSEIGKPPDPPYMAFMETGSDNFGADNKVYYKKKDFVVELYIKKNDYESEEKLENALDENEIYWEKGGQYYIKETKLVQIIYKI